MRKIFLIGLLSISLNSICQIQVSGIKRNTITPWDYTNVPGAFFILDFSRTFTMLQEDNTGICITSVVNDTDPIGEIYDLSASGMHVRALASTRRPLLSSDANRNSFGLFDGTDDFLSIPNSKKAFNKFVAASPVWTIMAWIKVNTDGSIQVIVDSNDRAAANNGIDIAIQADGTINMLTTDATANKTNVSTIATLKVVDGWTPVKIMCNGTGANASSIKIGAKATQTFTAVAGAGNDAGFDMTIGTRASSADRPAKYSLGALVFSNNAIADTDDAWLKFQGNNPARNANPFLVLDWKFDWADLTKMWQDIAKTTPVASNNDPIGAIDNSNTALFGPLNRDLAVVSNSLRPTYKTGGSGGKSYGDFNGIDTSIRLNNDYESGGRWVLVKVCRNRRAALGSHIFFGSLYVVVTGNAYPGAPVFGVEYSTLHPASGSVAAPDLKNTGLVTNVIVYRRNGSSFDAWSGNKVRNSSSNTDVFRISRIGDAFIAGWEYDGEDYLDIKYNGYLSDSEIESVIIDTINSTYGI